MPTEIRLVKPNIAKMNLRFHVWSLWAILWPTENGGKWYSGTCTRISCGWFSMRLSINIDHLSRDIGSTRELVKKIHPRSYIQ
jgi:hypothetical protein